mmetsp:Transcript_2720/g.9756  ORF Transcript_2720/g.9756 Transcript_2720/m.9756 type:complete len:87 (-) Transcript_2720:9-269(-)
MLRTTRHEQAMSVNVQRPSWLARLQPTAARVQEKSVEVSPTNERYTEDKVGNPAVLQHHVKPQCNGRASKRCDPTDKNGSKRTKFH